MRTFLPNWFKRTSQWLAILLPLAAHAQAPGNDDPTMATTLPLGTTCTPVSATNAGATTSGAAAAVGATTLGYSNPGCGIASSPKDVWFKFVTAATGLPGSTSAIITVTGTVAGQVRVFSSTGGGAGLFRAVGCSAGTANNTQAPPLSLQDLLPATTYYVFVSGYGSADAQGAFTICATLPPANDVSVDFVQALTQLPIPQGASQVVRAVLTNRGLSPQTNVQATLTATGANAFNDTQTIATLAAGASVTVSFAVFTSTAVGTNTLVVNTLTDDDNTNNSQSTTQAVNSTIYSYANAGPQSSSRGFGYTGSGGVFLCRFLASAPLNVTHVRAFLLNGSTGLGSTDGKTVYAVLMDGATNTVMARSASHVVTAAELGTYVSFPLTSLHSLPAGADVYVGLVQTYQPGEITQYFPLGTQPDGPGRTGAFYTATTLRPTAFADNGPVSKVKYMIEAVTVGGALCPAPTFAVSNITNTSATLSLSSAASASGYTLVYSAAGGVPTTVTSNGAPVTLTGLSPAIVYTVTASTTCGTQISFPGTFTFMTTQPGAPYAPLPIAEGFENSWQDVAATSDAPTNNWRNTPASGNQSWRRNDDGYTANWMNSWGSYAPASSQGAYSARFDSYDAPLGTTGALDLYVNMSAAGAKTLTFDYINVDGTDVLDVLVSTDGGATFSATPVLTARTSATFTPRSATIASTSATTVVRFRATSDHGVSDIGLDNVRLAVVTATRNEALAATVGLYPNPAHGAFTLAMPASPLGTAAATLLNALGQAVQTRQLRLPAAGGTAEFDVRGLAAGVYSLRLQTGETLVVKRVVIE